MLLLDDHASHVTSEAIRFCLSKKIILLCLPPHSTHILQALDVDVFAPLAIAYKNAVQKRCRFEASYNIDKSDFLELYQQAREDAMTAENIRKAWKGTGLSPFNPEVVLQHFPVTSAACPITPARESVLKVNYTPANVAEAKSILHQIRSEATLEIQALLDKLYKATEKAMTDLVAQKTINNELIEVSKAKEKRSTRQAGNYGIARVMDETILKERRHKALEAVWKDFAKIKPDLFTADITVARFRRTTKRMTAAQDRAFADAAASIMHRGPELFRHQR